VGAVAAAFWEAIAAETLDLEFARFRAAHQRLRARPLGLCLTSQGPVPGHLGASLRLTRAGLGLRSTFAERLSNLSHMHFGLSRDIVQGLRRKATLPWHSP
jgi:hypothetical protein